MRAPDQLFDPRLRRLRRARAARSEGDADFLHRRAADELVARLDLVARPFATALDFGWGDPYLAGRLRERGIHVVQREEGNLPSASGPFDLAVSVGALDTINDLPGALALIRRALKPDGLFLAAFAGAFGCTAPRIHPQIDVRAGGDLLARAGFALPVVDRDIVEVRYGSLMALVADLRAMGATNQLAGQGARPVGRSGLAAAIADFAADAGPDGKTGERFEIIHLSGWAPAPDQPRPARRGSGSASLADALKPRR